MIRLTLAGAELAGFELEHPAASVRLLIPSPGSSELVIPRWNGNEFLLEDGTRPVIRTFTPRSLTPHGLDLDIVVHEGGAVSDWAETANLGAAAAVSGPGRGYEVDGSVSGYLLIGDETAIPAISQLLEHIPEAIPVEAHLVVNNDFGRIEMPDHRDSVLTWREISEPTDAGAAMLTALQETERDETRKVWCAGEAAAVQAVRNHLFRELGLARALGNVRGYWKAR